MIKNKNSLNILKMIIFIILFLSALYFENAQQQRLVVLISIFLVLITNSTLKYFINKDSKLYFISIIIDSILIFLLEQNSRLLINYFLHSFYIIVLLEASITLNVKKGIVAGIIASFFSMIKFIYLVYFKFNLSSFSQFIFFFLINALILIIAIFAQYNKTEKEKKDTLYRELLDTHKKLKEYTEEVRRLSIIEEKNRIARDIHDNLGHNMTALIMQLQMSEHYMNQKNQSKSKELLEKSIQTAKDSLTGIREVVETLRGKDIIYFPQKPLRKLIDEFSEKTKTLIDLNVRGEVATNDDLNTAIYHILQESLTNAVRHGNATKIFVEIDYSDNAIEFSIRDNGKGAKSINEGYGLKGIRERVENLGGKIEFKSSNGFSIKGVIYLKIDDSIIPNMEEKND